MPNGLVLSSVEEMTFLAAAMLVQIYYQGWQTIIEYEISLLTLPILEG
jgi:hypothetical protein